MRDDARARHPSAEDVQRYVDAALDPTRDAALVAHVASCPTCAAEVERLRSVTAALALSSAPPADLLERIQARRRANELVILPTGEWEVPTLDGDRGPDGPGPRRPLDVAAALSLTSAPPDDLHDRIAARRATGEWVTLDVPSVARETRRGDGGSTWRAWRWRWAAPPAAVAATALLLVRLLGGPAGAGVGPARAVATTSGESAAPGAPTAPVTQAPSAPARPTVVAVAPAPARETFRGTSPAPDSASPDSATASVPETVAGVTVVPRGAAGSEPAIALAVSAAGLDSAQRAGLDSIAAAVRDDSTRRVLIRHAAPSAGFAARVAERLLLGGVAEERIVPRRVAAVRATGLGGGLAIEVVVEKVVPPRE